MPWRTRRFWCPSLPPGGIFGHQFRPIHDGTNFVSAIDYGIVIKEYGITDNDHRYSPATCKSIKKDRCERYGNLYAYSFPSADPTKT
jgi:hypothetical protein